MGTTEPALVAIFMGRQDDWETLRHAAEALDQFHVRWERWIAADRLATESVAEAVARFVAAGIQSLIVGAADDGELAAAVAGCSALPTLAVPLPRQTSGALETLLSLTQAAERSPFTTLAIGRAGATNAALLVVAILGNSRAELRESLRQFRAAQTAKVQKETLA